MSDTTETETVGPERCDVHQPCCRNPFCVNAGSWGPAFKDNLVGSGSVSGPLSEAEREELAGALFVTAEAAEEPSADRLVAAVERILAARSHRPS